MIKAVVGALKMYPNFNSSIDMANGELVQKQYYHIGVAVDTPNGLVVPVIRNCDQKNVLQVAAELTDLAVRARDRKLKTEEMQGGSFTITNLGGIGGTSFTPIVNYPEVAILGMSRGQTQLAMEDGQIAERLMLPLSLSYDHRAVNGADAARFIVKLSGKSDEFLRVVLDSNSANYQIPSELDERYCTESNVPWVSPLASKNTHDRFLQIAIRCCAFWTGMSSTNTCLSLS